MKRKLCGVVLSVVTLFSISSCSVHNTASDMTTETAITGSMQSEIERQVSQEIGDRIHGFLFVEIPYEESYSQIEVSTSKAIYKSKETRIECNIINHNRGHGFWFCWIPFVEKRERSEWKPVEYKREFLEGSCDYYAFCAIPDYPDSEFSTMVLLDTEKAYKDKYLPEGQYRFKVYVGKEIFYAEFEIKDLVAYD